MNAIFTDCIGNQYEVLEGGVPRQPEVGELCIIPDSDNVREWLESEGGGCRTIIKEIKPPQRLVFHQIGIQPRIVKPGQYYLKHGNLNYWEGFNGEATCAEYTAFRLVEGDTT